MSDKVSDFSRSDIFSRDELQNELRQCEILSGLTQYIYDFEQETVDAVEHAYVIVANQDCDLLWDFQKRQSGERGVIPSVLMFEAKDPPQARPDVAGSDVWKRIIQNQDERYHYIEACRNSFDLENVGLPSLIVDFKRFFTSPVSDVYKQLQSNPVTKRRSRLRVSYREHFQSRAAFFMQRVMLPRLHEKPAATR